jgi:hypothetical protein
MSKLAFEEKLRQILFNVPDKDKVRKIKNIVHAQLPTEEEIDDFLEKDWNHLFSPEEDYLGRRRLAQAIHNKIKESER